VAAWGEPVDVGLSGLVEWLGATPGSTGLHESLHLYSLIEATHVLAIMLFVGTIAMVDLRLLGVSFRQVSVPQMTSRILPWTIVGFCILVVTGILLFYAIPVRTYHSVWFRMKVVLLIVGLINIWVFHRRVQRDQDQWGADAIPPLGARITAGISLMVWAGVVVTGRMIAYNWFDCDRPQPDWIIAVAGCPPIPGM
jgi:hypothetical protein